MTYICGRSGAIIVHVSQMKDLRLAFFFISLSLGLTAQAQLDQNTNSVQFEVQEDDVPNPSGTTLPARKKPSLTIPIEERDPKYNMSNLGSEDDKELDIRTSDGLLDSEKGKTPKAFTKDKEPTQEYARDQLLGEMKTGGDFVSIKYRDHEYVDGDKIRVFVNGDIVQAGIYLTGSFSGFVLNLEEGENIIEFEALNQGSSGPNTAELHVYDENGFIISAKEWNLLTGYKARIRVWKE